MKHIDLLIYGATGFTGRFVVEALAKTLNTTGKQLRWAVAGRNRSRLEKCLNDASSITGVGLQHIECLEADINDRKSLENIFRPCRLVMNCTGPYSLLGEPVVDSCISTGTNYMDLSGEPLFMEKIMKKYHKQAIDKKVTIINSCGIDSIPADIGTAYLKDNFNGTLSHVEHYLQLWNKEESFSYATWLALIEGYKNRHQLKSLRKEIFRQYYRSFKWIYPLKRKVYAKNKFGHCLPFPGSDRSVVTRSQMERFTRLNELPVQFEAYFCSNELSILFKLAFLNTSIKTLSKYTTGEALLNKYSNFFSAGLFNKNILPKRENLEQNRFRITLIGNGWSDSIVEKRFNNLDRCSAVIIEGGDPAYLDTSVIAVQTAFVLLDKINNDRLPKGVLTPNSAIESNEIVPILNNNNVTFQFISEYEI